MTKMRRLLAVKPHKYGTRHLTAGEEYEAPARHALALLASKKVRYAAAATPPQEPPPTTPVRREPEPALVAMVEQMEDLRAQAEQLGIEVDGRWGRARLQYEITRVSSGVKGAGDG